MHAKTINAIIEDLNSAKSSLVRAQERFEDYYHEEGIRKVKELVKQVEELKEYSRQQRD